MLSNIFLNRVFRFSETDRVSLELRFGVRLLSINDNLALSFFFYTPTHSDLDVNVTSLCNTNCKQNTIHLSTMDLLVLATMKNAAKCENVV